MSLSRLRRRALRAYDAWLAAAGPWARWSLCLPLLGPGLDELGNLQLRRLRDPRGRPLAAEVATRLVDAPPTLLVLDLAPEIGLPVAATLARDGVARPLLLLGRWPYAQAVLAARPLLDIAIAESRALPKAEAPHLAVVLDADRTRPLPRRAATDPRVDNRYDLVPEDFPDLPTLQAAGVRRVVDVRGPGARVPGVLETVYAGYSAAGLLVSSP